MFLQMMIPDHASAIVMASAERGTGTDSKLKVMARKVVDDQAKEVGEMETMLVSG